jgi:hypothetical protein
LAQLNDHPVALVRRHSGSRRGRALQLSIIPPFSGGLRRARRLYGKLPKSPGKFPRCGGLALAVFAPGRPPTVTPARPRSWLCRPSRGRQWPCDGPVVLILSWRFGQRP